MAKSRRGGGRGSTRVVKAARGANRTRRRQALRIGRVSALTREGHRDPRRRVDRKSCPSRQEASKESLGILTKAELGPRPETAAPKGRSERGNAIASRTGHRSAVPTQDVRTIRARVGLRFVPRSDRQRMTAGGVWIWLFRSWASRRQALPTRGLTDRAIREDRPSGSMRTRTSAEGRAAAWRSSVDRSDGCTHLRSVCRSREDASLASTARRKPMRRRDSVGVQARYRDGGESARTARTGAVQTCANHPT